MLFMKKESTMYDHCSYNASETDTQVPFSSGHSGFHFCKMDLEAWKEKNKK